MSRLKFAAIVIVLPLLLAACAPQATTAPTAPPIATAAPAVAPTTAPSAAVAADSTVKVANDAKLGPILTDAKGMTLYRYTKDQADTSNCYDQCATSWPPVVLSAGQPVALLGLSGALGLITRNDGGKQLTYNKLPLYYWAKDAKPGDTTGQNVGTVWFVVKPGEAVAAPAPAATTVMTASDPKLGTILVDAKGMTLYRYTKDEANLSNCYDQCATSWPPLLATSGQSSLPAGLAGNLGTTTRKDGTKQLTYNGMPLYYWVKDAKPGDTTGQGVGSVWYVVQPVASTGQAPASTSSGTSY